MSKSDTPTPMTGFECENCGKKFDAEQVINLNCTCDDCDDSIAAYTVDVAEYVVQLKAQLAAAEAKVQEATSLLGAIKCPYCNGAGGFQVSEDESVQCEWCGRRDILTANCGGGAAYPERAGWVKGRHD